MKIVTTIISIFILVNILFTGCDSLQGTSKTEQKKETTKKGKIKLSLWFYYEGKDRYDNISDLCKGFNKYQNEYEIAPEYVPFADFKKQLSIGIAADKLPDVAIIDNPDHATYAAMGLFADITDEINDWPDKVNYYEGPMKSCIYKNKIYGIPFSSNCLALFYNTEMLDKSGVKPPQTWDELKATSKKLTTGDTKGFAISAPKNEEGTFQFLPWLLSTGATFEKVDSSEAVKSFTILADLVKEGSMSKEIINWTQADVLKQFIAKKTAMMINGPWQIPELHKNAPDLKYGVTLIPKDKEYASVLGGENLGVVNGKNVDGSVKFVKYVSSPKVLSKFLKSFGYFPPRKDLTDDKYWTDDPVRKVFADELKYAMPRGPHQKWPEISNAISEALQETITLTKNPSTAAKGAQAKIEKLLK